MQSSQKRDPSRRVRDARCGPGGWKCPCCGPTPSNRPKFPRSIKRGRMLRRLIEDMS
jgi:hypothetical protein